MSNPLQEASEWLMRLQEDRLPDEELARWIDWCDRDPENRAAFERLMPLWQAFDGREADELPQVTANASRQAAANAPERGMPVARKRQFVASFGSPFAGRYALAAALACVFLTAATIFVLRKAGTENPLPQTARLQSAPGVNRPATLPDGSMLELGARSSVAIDFAREKRQIDLGEGEAFFTVKPDRIRPFVVRAGEVQITAIGTQFNVLRAVNRIAITVQEGSVRVARPSSGSEPLLVPAGYQVICDNSGSAPARMRAIDPASSIAWRQGHLEYISEPLSSIVQTLNRYSNKPIALDEAHLGSLEYTGTIEVTSIEEWLRALPRIFPLEVHAAPDGVKIFSNAGSAS